MSEYTARGGFYWDTDRCVVSRGQYKLYEADTLDMGEPIQKSGSGMDSDEFFNKIEVHSYQLGAGSGAALGVGIKNINATDDLTDSYRASHPKTLRQGTRDLLIIHQGAVTVKNVGSSAIDFGDTVIPADGGMEKMTDKDNQYSLGRSLDLIGPGEYGLIWVDPNYHEAIV